MQSPERLLTLQVPAPIVQEEGSAAGGGARQQRVTAMARRRATKARSKSAPAGARTPRGKAARGQETGARANGGLRERLAAAERERDQLKEDLERSKARLEQLEAAHAQVRDRIAWALDSLHNILEGKG